MMHGAYNVKFINVFATGIYPDTQEFIVYPPIVCNIYFNITLPSTSSSPKWFQQSLLNNTWKLAEM